MSGGVMRRSASTVIGRGASAAATGVLQSIERGRAGGGSRGRMRSVASSHAPHEHLWSFPLVAGSVGVSHEPVLPGNDAGLWVVSAVARHSFDTAPSGASLVILTVQLNSTNQFTDDGPIASTSEWVGGSVSGVSVTWPFVRPGSFPTVTAWAEWSGTPAAGSLEVRTSAVRVG